MADIRHAIQIAAPAQKVFALVSSGDGFAKWWAEDMALRADGTADMGFFDRSTIYSMKPARMDGSREAEWVCTNGKEWEGTKVIFELSENKGQTTLKFSHDGWREATEYFRMCNTTWGGLMFRIKSAAEGRETKPLFSKSGMNV